MWGEHPGVLGLLDVGHRDVIDDFFDLSWMFVRMWIEDDRSRHFLRFLLRRDLCSVNVITLVRSEHPRKTRLKSRQLLNDGEQPLELLLQAEKCHRWNVFGEGGAVDDEVRLRIAVRTVDGRVDVQGASESFLEGVDETVINRRSQFARFPAVQFTLTLRIERLDALVVAGEEITLIGKDPLGFGQEKFGLDRKSVV